MNITRHKLLSRLLYLILVITIVTSCSSNPSKAIQFITLNSNIPAECKFTDTWGTRLVSTPGKVYADPRHGPARLLCKSSGYADYVETEIGGSKNNGRYPAVIPINLQKIAPEIHSEDIETELPIAIEPVEPVELVDPEIIFEPPMKNVEEISDTTGNSSEAILNRDPSHYTLSLFSMRTKENAIKAIDKYDIKEQAVLFSYHKLGQQWHVVTYGDYATAAIAKHAITTLPNNLTTLKPWIRSYSAIHNDIRESESE